MRGFPSQLTRFQFGKVYSDGGQQLVDLKGMAGQTPTQVYRPETHGLSTHPVAGAQGALLALGGRQDQLLALGGECSELRGQHQAALGETILYNSHGEAISLIKRQVRMVGQDMQVTIAGTANFD
ncbi:phage baseplate assembly protein [Ahrensia sp. R2A130]|uniref:phage baseplate assembly protein domain-containing protein n=1 Tax=Ahrensia sp. R2A130 TaxID=744979 RepID=UPI0001E0B504|nr:phage baseplate assembly protein [Ahrensia sp. R2A130]EFL88274.1 conserved hypothetical protein [Ahrensia sp. R2A130]